jgi:PilZ domain-containing protein
VERRRESRLNVNKAVKLKVLDRMAGPSLGRAIDAEVVDVSGSGMRLRMKVPVPCGAPVEVDDQHLTLLGEICRCVQDPDGSYTVGLRVIEMLVSSYLRESSFPARS